jgi:hypothetical protein
MLPLNSFTLLHFFVLSLDLYIITLICIGYTGSKFAKGIHFKDFLTVYILSVLSFFHRQRSETQRAGQDELYWTDY